ncbi:hypothetical protein PG993_007094 [Apiospora rasikravindrae]|uniref:Uncharacterized protein n=1 Tax=Apiospora rasikravindrae TaxID=990691 RepID=A0ABR1SWJ2_9PEZI
MSKYFNLKPQPADNDLIPADVEDPLVPPTQQSSSSAGRGMSRNSRNCPNARFCWPFDWSSWTLDTGGDAPALMRRLCMWITLATRTALAVFSLVFLFVGFDIGGFVVNIVLDVLGFFFIAWCLARIGDAVGERRVLGTLVGRWHFDLFLLGSAAIHIIMIATVFVYKSRVGFLTSWYGMWILIFAVAWVAGWAPEGTSYV